MANETNVNQAGVDNRPTYNVKLRRELVRLIMPAEDKPEDKPTEDKPAEDKPEDNRMRAFRRLAETVVAAMGLQPQDVPEEAIKEVYTKDIQLPYVPIAQRHFCFETNYGEHLGFEHVTYSEKNGEFAVWVTNYVNSDEAAFAAEQKNMRDDGWVLQDSKSLLSDVMRAAGSTTIH